MKNLYLISQTENDGYDVYDSAVVCAESEEDAREIHPANGHVFGENYKYPDWNSPYDIWASHPNNVTVKYIGEASDDIELNSIICASFNAG